MRTSERRFLIAIFAATVGVPSPGCASETDNLTPKTREDFEWFSGLGFPDTKGCAYVQVATGEWSQSGAEPRRPRLIKGFLLATNSSSFRVLTRDLLDRSFAQTNSEAKPYTQVGFEILALTNEVAEALRVLHAPPAKNDSWRRSGERLTERAEVFGLAWACWRNGLGSSAQELYNEARRFPSRRGRDETTSTFRETLERDLGHAMMWRAVVSFGDPSISRSQLLALFESIVSNYPQSEHQERARQTASVLNQMLSEDELHSKTMITNLDQLPMEQRVSELIFRLRDQNGQQFSQPGWCDIFGGWRGNTNTPAHQLVRLGYTAVPQLIEALDNSRFSRSVGFHRDFYFSHIVLTVGDCAQEIL